MPDALLDDHAIQVLKSFRPYLGERGNGFLTTLESLQELLTSEPAQKTVNSFRMFGFGERFTSLEVKSEAEPNPFNLFLILVLLVLADIPSGFDPPGGAGLHETAPHAIPVQFLP